MKYYVFYEDDYSENGGIGLEEFESETEATVFIEGRISERDTDRTINCYTLIQGKERKIKAIETVTRIEVDMST